MNTSSRFGLALACLLVLGGCAGNAPQPARKPDFAKGGRVFDQSCARCHMDPDNDAPQLDEADDWDLRTHLWASILKDHVKNGFIRMPAKGGHAALNDQDIDDALYYMEVKIKALQ
jgi:cytochrome c5